MKKSIILMFAVSISMMATACGNSKETKDASSAVLSNANDAATAKSQTQSQKPLPESEEYSSADGLYKVTLLKGLTQSDMQIQANSSMMGLEGGTSRSGFSGIAMGSPKGSVPGNPAQMESLNDYADHLIHLTFKGSGVSVDWNDIDAETTQGADLCLAREGVAKSNGTKGSAYIYCAETADSYYGLLLIGSDDDVNEARKVFSLEIIGGQATDRGSKGFISSMTAALDTVNGSSIMEIVKTLHDMGTDASQLDVLTSQAKLALADSWDIEDAAALMEMADWLMKEGHNQESIESLIKFNPSSTGDRDSFKKQLEESGEAEDICNSILAAYDAWSAYGDDAISAWDLSRVNTIMGFGYGAGYCTYEEAMDKCLEAAKKAQESFQSWEDFNQSYLNGYAYWTGESLDDPDSSAGNRAEIIKALSSQANGPFSVDWNMELKKDW